MMFSNIDKKILIILIIALALIILSGVAVFKFFSAEKIDIQNFIGGTEMEQKDADEVKIEAVEIEPGSGSESGLFICADKCGDGVCQIPDSECQNNLNCPCPENQQECPQDCK